MGQTYPGGGDLVGENLLCGETSINFIPWVSQTIGKSGIQSVQ